MNEKHYRLSDGRIKIVLPGEEEAFDAMVDSEPNETYELSNNPEIELDDSLDEAQESDLKERKWNPDVQ